MTHLRELWLPLLATLTGAALLALGWRTRQRHAGPAWARMLFGGALLAFGIGGLVPIVQYGSVREPLSTADIGFWLATVCLALFIAKFVVLILSGHWYALPAAGLAGVGLVGL